MCKLFFKYRSSYLYHWLNRFDFSFKCFLFGQKFALGSEFSILPLGDRKKMSISDVSQDGALAN